MRPVHKVIVSGDRLALKRMPASDWSMLLECIEVWHGLAPHVFPKLSSHRLVGVRHSFAGSSGEDTASILNRIGTPADSFSGSSGTHREQESGSASSSQFIVAQTSLPDMPTPRVPLEMFLGSDMAPDVLTIAQNSCHNAARRSL